MKGNMVIKVVGPISDTGFRWSSLMAHRYGLRDAWVIYSTPLPKCKLEDFLRGYVKPEKKEVAKIKLILDW